MLLLTGVQSMTFMTRMRLLHCNVVYVYDFCRSPIGCSINDSSISLFHQLWKSFGLHSEHCKAPNWFIWSLCRKQGITAFSSGNTFPISGKSCFKLLYSNGLKHIPFLVGTTSSCGFQNCLISTHTLFSPILQKTFPPRWYVNDCLFSNALSTYSSWSTQFFHRIKFRLMPFLVGLSSFHSLTSTRSSPCHSCTST